MAQRRRLLLHLHRAKLNIAVRLRQPISGQFQAGSQDVSLANFWAYKGLGLSALSRHSVVQSLQACRLVAAGQVLTEVGAISGSTVLATRKRLSFAGEPLCDGPGEALTQRQSGVPELQGGGRLKYWLPKVLRSEAAEVPVEQELRLTASMAAGDGSGKVLWLDVTVPGLAISRPKASACTALHKTHLGDPTICSTAPILGSGRRATSSAPCSAPCCCCSSSVSSRAVCSTFSCDAATGGGGIQAGARP